ncbi:MAG TPA: diphthamide biosynthesis enzyme Dph2, partial [Thermoplasmatales archaeon]|nr:diphthamide biosynthesis enzyme Dph2 [Thermoplasmatales archaeon]HEX17226.1 diphthamide biosynthesis enzyme Dph2 [Thermoplasmatales archaeon]
RRIKRDLEKREKKAHLLIMDDVRPDLIEDLGGFDCLVSTACPRVAIDDYQGFDIPILTPVELEMVIGKRRMEDYEIDTFSP